MSELNVSPNTVVSAVTRLDPPLDEAPEAMEGGRGVSVEFADGSVARLDGDDRRSRGFAQVLDGLRKEGLPVYVELDPETSAIKLLLIPHVARVVGVQPSEDALDVEIAPSHARHVLRRDARDFEAAERQLRESLRSGDPVVLTETDAHEILDVRPYMPGPEVPQLPPFPKLLPAGRFGIRWTWLRWLYLIWWWPWWPWWWFGCMSRARAQQIFDAMNATSCDPLTVPSPCIPFLYPDDGCWGRAHEMRRLMLNMGVSPRKVWIQGQLHTPTRNNPNCFVNWGWHVAPTVCVRGPWFFMSERLVIDPSLFTTPVSKSMWKSVQGDPNATLTDSDGSIFYLWGNVTDPTHVQTNQVLATYRLQLQNRAIQVGPPPYANCP
jgi:hypothetical protein